MTNMVSNLHFSTSSKEIIEYFTNLAGPVKSVAFCLNNCGIYNGQVKIIFHAPGDARKAVWSNNATEIRHHSFHERKKSVLSSYRGTSRPILLCIKSSFPTCTTMQPSEISKIILALSVKTSWMLTSIATRMVNRWAKQIFSFARIPLPKKAVRNRFYILDRPIRQYVSLIVLDNKNPSR